MKLFVDLFHNLGNTSSTSKKVELIATYFLSASKEDRDIALYILSGGNIKRQVTSTELRRWATEYSAIPNWLFEESYHVVGDLAETIALLCRSTNVDDPGSLAGWVRYLEELKGKTEEVRKRAIFEAWGSLSSAGIIVFNKLMTAGLRIGVAKGLVVKALSQATKIPEPTISQRLTGELGRNFSYDVLLTESDTVSLNPYPFYLAYALEADPNTLGDPSEWLAEWKWDGIRGQLVVRDGKYALWSRGEELLTDNFPEFSDVPDAVPDGTVLDGEIIGWENEAPLPFALLQKRITRKKITAAVLAECPITFLAYDLLENAGRDIRSEGQVHRREQLRQILALVKHPRIRFPEDIHFSTWKELGDLRARSRDKRAEGVMIKHRNASYQTGRRRGEWWKWKLDPLTIDGVLIYAQKGHGRRADLYTDYTFGVWEKDSLVPITKAYSGLTDAEFREVDAFIKSNVIEKFGPVRTVKPELVFEIAFEGIQASTRHKSGIALRFPRMARWRRDKPASEADTLENVREILKGFE